MSSKSPKTDSPETNGPETDGTGTNASQIRVHAQYVKDLSFETPNPPPNKNNSKPANIEMSIDVHANPQKKHANSAEIILKILAQAKYEENVLFILELSYAGIFQLINIPPKDTEAVFLIEAPRQLFPFARRIVADLSREGGFPPLLIDPIDFAALYLSHRGKKKSEKNITRLSSH